MDWIAEFIGRLARRFLRVRGKKLLEGAERARAGPVLVSSRTVLARAAK